MDDSLTPIRKQVYELSPQDLVSIPLWEFCSDEEEIEGQDEATVKPSVDTEVPGYSPGSYILTADLTFADGSDGLGYIYSGKPTDLGCMQPNIVLDHTQINLWLGSLAYLGDVTQYLSGQYQKLGKSPSAIFPLTFESRAKINGSHLLLTVDSFLAIGARGQIENVS